MKLFPNFTSIPFDYLLISWVTSYVNNLGFLTFLWRGTLKGGGGGGGGGGGLNTATPQKILPNTASPQEKSLHHRHRNIYFQSDDFSVSTR